jgi:hypothetical protein
MTLLISVISYAILWFFNLSNQAFLQKPALAAIIYVEMYGSTVSRYFGERNIIGPSPCERVLHEEPTKLYL